ncbi:MAG: DUF4389 domain-containing protein [Chloroflexi bacterium]|nr:DUF4389 domain-containing protein [Chloroflexota bacterium]
MSMETVVEAQNDDFPVRFEADYKDRLSRLSTAFRLILAIPLVIVVGLLGGGTPIWGVPAGLGFGLASGLLVFHWLAVLIRGRPVGWVFDVLVAIQRFIYRSYTYFFLISDHYPPFEGDWQIRYEVERPERLSRWRLVIWKTVSSVPHFVALSVLSFAVAVVVLISWIAILFSGRFPKGLHDFVIGWLRWTARVSAYWMSLTDDFPAFGFSAETGRATNSSYVISCVVGVIISLAAVGLFTLAIVSALSPGTTEVNVSYEGLQRGQASELVVVSDVLLTLESADDDYVSADRLLAPHVGERFVLFSIDIIIARSEDLFFHRSEFRLKDSVGETRRAELVTVNGTVAPVRLAGGSIATIQVLFEVNDSARPLELTFELTFISDFGLSDRVKFVLE